MENGFFHLSSRKLYIICTVVIFVFMLYLYSQYNVAPLRIHGFGNDEQVVQENQTDTTILDLGMNDFKEILMEHVNLNYPRNIYITIKTTHKFYLKRVLPLMLTWLQTVDENKVRCQCCYYRKAIVNTYVPYIAYCLRLNSFVDFVDQMC